MEKRKLIRAATSVLLSAALVTAACKSPVTRAGEDEGAAADVSLRFIVRGASDAAARLLLDNAASLTVELTLGGAPAPTAARTVDISPGQTEATVSFSDLAYGNYTVLALAQDASGRVVARQESGVAVGGTAAGAGATLYMLPASIDEAASVGATTGEQTLADSAAIAAGETRTWTIPTGARHRGRVAFDLGNSPGSVLAFLQDGQGTLLNADPAARRGNARSASAGPVFLTVYNAGGAAALTLRLNIQVQLFFDGGDGTADAPYLVSDADGLDYARNHLSAHFRQTADIDLSAFADFTPIGKSGNRFLGSYDGGGFTISNLTITNSAEYRGLFGQTYGATLKNVKLVGVAMTGGFSHAGALVGGATSNTTISGCSASGVVASTSASGSNIGGLVGWLSSSGVSASSAAVDVSSSVGGTSVGGLVGQCNGGTIETSSSSGNVSGVGDYVGGLAGSLNSSATVSNCYARGATVTGAKATTAGFAYVSASSIADCYAANRVVVSLEGATAYGFARHYTAGNTMTGCFWDSEASGTTVGSNMDPYPTVKTGAEMRTAATFTGAGWDANVWNLADGAYPTLR
jgi:hypothetical protein